MSYGRGARIALCAMLSTVAFFHPRWTHSTEVIQLGRSEFESGVSLQVPNWADPVPVVRYPNRAWYAALRPDGHLDDGQTSIVYDANTGRVMLDAPADMDLTSLRIESRSAVFTGDPARNLDGDFDLDEDHRIFKATFGDRFGSLDFGKIAAPYLPEQSLRKDLTIDGTLDDGRSLVGVDLIYLPGTPVVQGLASGGKLNDAQTSIIYDATTGRLSLDAPKKIDLTSIDITSANGIFGGRPAHNLDGIFDTHVRNNLFKATFDGGFGSMSFGKVAETGLAESLLQRELTVVGNLAGGGNLGTVDLIYVPGVPFVTGLKPGGKVGDERASIVYFASTGRVLLDMPTGVDLQAIDLDSNGPVFTGLLPQNLDGPFDTQSDVHVYKAQLDGRFGSVNLGRVARTGLPESLWQTDLRVIGNLAGGGGLTDVDLLYFAGEEVAPGIPAGGRRDDQRTSIVYEFETGAVSIDAATDAELSWIDIHSATGIFRSGGFKNLGGVFDMGTDHNLFKADLQGRFGSFEFGLIAQPHLSQSFLENDLSVAGMLVGGGGLGSVDLIYLRSLLRGQVDDHQTSVIYDASTGRVMVDAPRGSDLNSIRIGSMDAVFTGESARNLDGDFDLDEDDRIFKSQFGGSFGSVVFGKVAQPGLSETQVRNDFSIVGSLVGGKDLGDVDLVYIPGKPAEPGLRPGGTIGDHQMSIVYYANTGRLVVDAPTSKGINSLDIVSENAVFTASPAENLDGPLDSDTDNNLYKVLFDRGFESLNLGRVAPGQLSQPFVQKDLTVAGAMVNGDHIRQVDLVHVPAVVLQQGGQRDDGRTSIVYYANNGLVSLDTPRGIDLTSIDILSEAGIFSGRVAGNLPGPLDSETDHALFKATVPGRFGSFTFGLVAKTGLSESFLLNDLTIAGTLLGGGTLGHVDLVYLPSLVVWRRLQPNGQVGDLQTSIIYDASTGRLMVDAPPDVDLTSINIESAAAIFTREPAQQLASQFDIDRDGVIFKSIFAPGSFRSLSFGKVAPPELSQSFLQNDLSVIGSRAQGGDLGEVDLVYVPGSSVARGISARGRLQDGQTSLVYDANSGELQVDGPLGRPLMLLDIDSSSGIFTGVPAQNLAGPFDTDTDTNLFKAKFDGGFGSVTFGNVSPPRLPQSLLQRDLKVAGATVGGLGLGDVDLVYIPDRTVVQGVQTGGQLGDEQTSLVYFAGSGRMLIDAPLGSDLTWIDISSSASLLTGRHARNLEGRMDQHVKDNIFRGRFQDGFGAINLGKVVQTDLNEGQLQADLTVTGTRVDGLSIGHVDLLYVPGRAPPAGVQSAGQLRDSTTSLVYYAHSGRMMVDAPVEADLTSIDIHSATAVFTGSAAQNLDGPFDVDTDADIFRVRMEDGFGSFSLGRVALANLTESLLQNDLTVTGSLANNDDFGSADLVYVPGARLLPNGTRRDGQTSIIYDVSTGRLSVDGPAGSDLTSLDIVSAAGIFTAKSAQNVDGPWDVAQTTNLFRVAAETGFNSFSFGTVTPPDLSESVLRKDLIVGGTLVGGGHLGAVDLIYLRSLLSGRLEDGQTSILYDASTGRLMIDVPTGSELTSIRIASVDAILRGEPAQHLGGDFDIDTDNMIFKAQFGGSFGSFSLGKVAKPGLTEATVQTDLSLVGTFADGRGLGDVDLIYVPGSPVATGVRLGGRRNDQQTSIIYDATTGRVMVDAPSDTDLTSVDIASAAAVFTGRAAQNLDGPFDTDTGNNIYKARFGGHFGSFGLGRIASPDLSESQLQKDLTVTGTLVDGDNLGSVDLIYIPAKPVTPGVQAGGQPGDEQTSIIYYADTGRLLLDAPKGVDLTSIDILSAAGIFSGGPAQNLNGPFDAHVDDNIFKATFDGRFGSLNFGRLAQRNLTEAVLQSDLTVIGSLVDQRSLENVDLVYFPGSGVDAGVRPGGERGDQQTSLIYDVGTGQLSLDAPAGVELASIEIDSAAGIFTGHAQAQSLGGVFDALTENNLFKTRFDGGFASLTFGPIAGVKLTESFLQNDLTVSGTLIGGGGLGAVDLIFLKSLLSGRIGDGQTSVIYDANTGRVMVDAPAGSSLTSIRIGSTGSLLTGQPALGLGGDFDIDADDAIFKATFGDSFGSLSFGKVAPAGLSESQMRNDLIIEGTLFDGNGLGDVDLIYIPGGPAPPGLRSGGHVGDRQTSIIYYANSGRLIVDAPADMDLTSVDIESSSAVFTGRPARNLGGPFDEYTDQNIYKAQFGGRFGSLSLGRVAQPGMSEAQLRNDLAVVGSLVDGGNLGPVDLVYVPGGAAAAGILPGGQLGDATTSLIYFTSTGRLLLEAPTNARIMSIDIDSADAIFSGKFIHDLAGPLDDRESDNLFKANFRDGFAAANLGKVARPNLSQSFLQNDLAVHGTLTDSGTLGEVDLIYLSGGEIHPGLQPSGQQGDRQTSVIYDANTGQVSIDAPVDMELAWIDIQSQDGIFGRGPVQNLGGPFDAVTLDNLFKATLDGSFGSMTFGHVARTRLSEEFLHTDLSVAGMLANGAGVGAVDLVYIPHSGAGLTTIFYDPNTGHIWVVPPAGFEFTSVNIDSAAGVFTNDPADNLGGSFDNDADNNVFKATFGDSFGVFDLGNVAKPGLSAQFVLNDLTIVGSLAGGGDLGEVNIVIGAPIVPEPSTLVTLAVGLLGSFGWRRGTRVPARAR